MLSVLWWNSNTLSSPTRPEDTYQSVYSYKDLRSPQPPSPLPPPLGSSSRTLIDNWGLKNYARMYLLRYRWQFLDFLWNKSIRNDRWFHDAFKMSTSRWKDLQNVGCYHLNHAPVWRQVSTRISTLKPNLTIRNPSRSNLKNYFNSPCSTTFSSSR